MKSLELLLDYKYLGKKELKDGTLLIGRAPHIAPHAWLHCIYPKLKKEEIDYLESQLENHIPKDYKRFLMISNGLGIFNTTLSLFGLRKTIGRDIDSVWQPFNIVIPNTIEKPKNANKNVFIIGSYDWDGSYLYINKNTNRVHVCRRDDSTSLYEWDSFEQMLEKEIRRLIMLFDENGIEKNADRSTLPFD